MIKKVILYAIRIFYFFTVCCVVPFLVLILLGCRMYVVQSGSMEPAIHTGALAIVNEKASYQSIQPNDIIAYKTETGAKVTHRAISIQQEGIETKGDANDISDGITTTERNFQGKTITSIPLAGYFFDWCSDCSHKIIVVSLLLACLLLENLCEDEMTEKTKEGA